MSKPQYVFPANKAEHLHKFGCDLTAYNEGVDGANIIRVSTKRGHLEEFRNTSHFIYYVIEGEGVFVINDEQVPIKAGDLVVVPPNTRFYYFGKLELLLTVTPRWHEESETHIRAVNLRENPMLRKK